MPRINANTGRLFHSSEEVLSLAQAVEDALYTIRGTRRYRSYYGSYITDWGRGLQEIIPTIHDTLQDVDGVDTVDIQTTGQTLRVIINDAQVFDVADLPRGGSLRWGLDSVAWSGQELQYGL